jgi:hypothetical protein
MTSPNEHEAPVKPKRPRRPSFVKWAKDADRPDPYNPLDLTQLGESVERRLLELTPAPLTNVPKTIGPGVYAIYYAGDHELYEPISSRECAQPIYVGKAVPQGGRKGTVDASRETAALWERLLEHKYSLDEAKDLDPSDFFVRFLVAVEVFVPLTERVMIQQLKPVWNLIVDGFGNHDPGAGRRNQARPPWDELHPGRWWSHPYHMSKPSKFSRDESAERVRNFLAGEDVAPDIDDSEEEATLVTNEDEIDLSTLPLDL